MMKLIEAIKKPFEHFEQTIIEGNYHPSPRSLFSTFARKKQALPETTSVVMSDSLLGISKILRNRFMWGAIFGFLAVNTLVAATVGLAVAGTGLLAFEYARARKAAREEITEVNMAGQHVKGARADLCRLHKAQEKIMNMGNTFKQASLDSTHDTINAILGSVEGERARVIVLSGGPYGAGSGVYSFSRPQMSLVSEDGQPGNGRAPSRIQPSIISALKPLRDNYNSRTRRDAQIVEQMAALHDVLTPEQKKLFREKLEGKNGPFATSAPNL